MVKGVKSFKTTHKDIFVTSTTCYCTLPHTAVTYCYYILQLPTPTPYYYTLPLQTTATYKLYTLFVLTTFSTTTHRQLRGRSRSRPGVFTCTAGHMKHCVAGPFTPGRYVFCILATLFGIFLFRFLPQRSGRFETAPPTYGSLR